MKVTMVIPSYWGRESRIGWQKGDAIYDHPIPLDHEGTLLRAIESIKILQDKDFQLAIIAVPTTKDIDTEVEAKVETIIKSVSHDVGVDILLFGPSHLEKIHDIFFRNGKEDYTDILELRGYSNIRNLCLFIPHILNSDISVLIDDDEVFEDKEFMSKAKEHIGNDFEGKPVLAVAGYYLQKDGGYLVKSDSDEWTKSWKKNEKMNEGFRNYIGTGARLKVTPFVFGGNMVIHRDIYMNVPFDPNVTRGEDIDFLMNAKMFGYNFYLDNQLSIKHLPPPKTHPVWRRLREDIYRFIYQRAKIESQKDIEGMTRIYPEDFDPYPGYFFKSDLDEIIETSCKMLSEQYLDEDDKVASKETLRNITLAKTEANPQFDPFEKMCNFQNRWQKMMEFVDNDDIRNNMQEILI